jgi:predicted Kef-type K+ transport protein
VPTSQTAVLAPAATGHLRSTTNHGTARRRALVLTLVKVLAAIAVGMVVVAVLRHAAPALAQHYGQATLPVTQHP